MEPYYQTKLGKLYHGDCLDILPKISGATACVTDPPYGLNFMGKDWDHGVPGIRYWKAVMDSCLPGAPLLAFGGTRTVHRLVCAIEDAGWEIRDGIEYFHWIHGSGFPKSHDISKGIDNAERVVPHGGADPTNPNHGKYKGGCSDDNLFGRGFGAGPGQFMAEFGEKDDRVLVESAKQWEGYGTSLKPAHEPICFAMKPIEGTFANNALKHGVAGINIDGCLVGNTKRTPGYKNPGSDMVGNSEWNDRYGGGVRREVDQTKGRWPANIILQHHPECELIGTKKVKAIKGGGGIKAPGKNAIYGEYNGKEYPETITKGDSEVMKKLKIGIAIQIVQSGLWINSLGKERRVVASLKMLQAEQEKMLTENTTA